MKRKIFVLLIILTALLSTSCIGKKENDNLSEKTLENEKSSENVGILIYSLPDEIFARPLTEIPYYQQGEVLFKEDSFFEQWQEGHQPWLAGAVDVVTVMCSNLIGLDAQGAFDNENIALHTAEELRTKNGIEIKVIEKIEEKFKVELIVPNLGKYEITLESPDKTGVLFIREIILYIAKGTFKRPLDFFIIKNLS